MGQKKTHLFGVIDISPYLFIYAHEINSKPEALAEVRGGIEMFDELLLPSSAVVFSLSISATNGRVRRRNTIGQETISMYAINSKKARWFYTRPIGRSAPL